jgi:hypothetical protein
VWHAVGGGKFRTRRHGGFLFERRTRRERLVCIPKLFAFEAKLNERLIQAAEIVISEKGGSS